jgi:hypothetical protein
VIAVDTNVLVYAHREDAAFHAVAYSRIASLAEGRSTWAIPWPCIHEFLAVVTHRRIFAPPTPLKSAMDQIDAWIESPSLVLLSEPDEYWPSLRKALEASRVAGPKVYDARVATLCLQHGVSELWSADRDFGRFRGLKVVNPLVD